MNEKISFNSIINALVQKSNVKKTFAHSFVKEMAQIIQEGLLRDNVVTLKGFGIFKLHNVPERSGRNLQTGETITIAAHRKVLFKPEKQLRELINKNYQHLKATFFTDDDNLESNGVILREEPGRHSEDISLNAVDKNTDKQGRVEEKTPILEATIDNSSAKKSEIDELANIDEKEDHFKKTLLIVSVILILTIILLYFQFSDDDSEQTAAKEATEQVSRNAVSPKKDANAAKEKQLSTKPPDTNKTKVTSARAHKAEDGDNLWKLASKYYNDGYLWPLIFQANKEEIKNPDFIKSGIEISIPPLSKKNDTKLIAKGHLMAYEEYKKKNDPGALDHLYVAYKYDKTYVEKFSEEIDAKDLKSVKDQLSK